MAVTPIDLDEEALAAAMSELGTSTKKDTVNTALREIAARNSRQRAFERLLQLGDPSAGERAWRRRKGHPDAASTSATGPGDSPEP